MKNIGVFLFIFLTFSTSFSYGTSDLCCSDDLSQNYELSTHLDHETPCDCPDEDCPENNCPDCHCGHTHVRHLFIPQSDLTLSIQEDLDLLQPRDNIYQHPYLEGNKRPPKYRS